MLLLPAGGFAQQCGLTMNLALEKKHENNILLRESFVQTMPCWANLQAQYYVLTENGFAHGGLPLGLPLGLPVGLRAPLPHGASPHPKRWRRQRRQRPSRGSGGCEEQRRLQRRSYMVSTCSYLFTPSNYQVAPPRYLVVTSVIW